MSDIDDARPTALLLHDTEGGPSDWADLSALLSMHAEVLTPTLGSADPLADLRHAIGARTDLAVVAVGAAAHLAYALASEGRATALVLVAADPPDASTADAVRDVEIPVFLIWGEDDTVTPVSVGEDLTDIFALATLAVVPDSGHDVLATDAPTVLPLIKEYLKVRAFGTGGHQHDAGPVMVDVSFSRPTLDRAMDPEVD